MTETLLRTREITQPTTFSLSPGVEDRTRLAEEFSIIAIRKLSFVGEIAPDGSKDLRLAAKLGATVVQPCVVTLDPVTTRVEELVTRSYLAELPDLPEGDEFEMPEDESAEPMPREIDLFQVMSEALALALPPWPRAEGADPVDLVVTEPGKRPMSDDDAKPFAELRSLRDQLGKTDGESD